MRDTVRSTRRVDIRIINELGAVVTAELIVEVDRITSMIVHYETRLIEPSKTQSPRGRLH